MRRLIVLTSILFFLLTVSCGYRFVDPFPGKGYALEEVRNVTSEPGLDRILAQGFRDFGSFDPHSKYRLTVVVTRFEETVAAISSGGVPIRQSLRMEVSWKVQGDRESEATFGKEAATKTYPYSDDPATLDWNRAAALRLLANTAAQQVLERLEAAP